MAMTLSWWSWFTTTMSQSFCQTSQRWWTDSRFQWRTCPRCQTRTKSKRFSISDLIWCDSFHIMRSCMGICCGISVNFTLRFVCFSCIKSLPRRRSVGPCWTQLCVGWPPKMSCNYNRKKDQNRTLRKRKEMVVVFQEMWMFCCWCFPTTLCQNCKPFVHSMQTQININYRKSHIFIYVKLIFTYLLMDFICLLSCLYFLCNC